MGADLQSCAPWRAARSCCDAERREVEKVTRSVSRLTMPREGPIPAGSPGRIPTGRKHILEDEVAGSLHLIARACFCKMLFGSDK